MSNFFNSKYPIYVPGMFGCSDANLAIAVAKAGCVPSLISYSDNFMQDLERCAKEIPSLEFAVCIDAFKLDIVSDPLHRELVKKLVNIGPKYIEFWPSKNYTSDGVIENVGFGDIESQRQTRDLIKLLRKKSKIIMRVYQPQTSQYDDLIDAYTLKSNESAGGFGKYSSLEFLAEFKKLTDKPLIPQGGVGTSAQIKKLLGSGADAVGIGTRFAISNESSLSNAAKLAIVNSNTNDLVILENTSQRAIIFNKDEIDLSLKGSDWNRNDLLAEGIKTGKTGLVYVGNAINQISKVAPVAEIVAELVKDL